MMDHLKIGHFSVDGPLKDRPLQVKLLGGVGVMEHMRAWIQQGGLPPNLRICHSSIVHLRIDHLRAGEVAGRGGGDGPLKDRPLKL